MRRKILIALSVMLVVFAVIVTFHVEITQANSTNNKYVSDDDSRLVLSEGWLFSQRLSPRSRHIKKKCGDGICDKFEKANPNLCPSDCNEKRTSSPEDKLTGLKLKSACRDRDYDADGLIIGTESMAFWFNNQGEIVESIDVINNVLNIKNVKLRVDQFKMTKDENGRFLPYFCRLDLKTNRKNCELGKYDLDKIIDAYVKNGWNLYPMFGQQNQFSSNRRTFNDEIMKEYVEFIEWFLDRYYMKVNIPYIEPGNNPANNWREGKGSSTQLIEQQNIVYDRIKRKYPDLIITSPGFEFHSDDGKKDDWANNLLAAFLNKDNGAKFDALAIHGFPPTRKNKPVKSSSGLRKNDCRNGFCYYPPTIKTVYNKYAGIAGILELRKKLDDNGWHDRKIFDTEHWLNLPKNRGNIIYSEEQDDQVAAVSIQDFLLRKTLKHNGQFVLSGINTILIGRRGSLPIKRQGSLMPDGSVTKHLKAMSFFWAKLCEYYYDMRLSGEFDKAKKAWVEKFKTENKELYIFFKPFEFEIGKNEPFGFDGEILKFELELDKKPTRLTLIDMYGKEKTLSPQQHVTLEITNAPRYLEVTY